MKNAKQVKGGWAMSETKIQYAIILVLAVLLTYNLTKLNNAPVNAISNVPANTGAVTELNVLPSGTPAIYGDEIGVSYDDVSVSNPTLADATMEKLSEYEDMQLNSELMTRYIKIGSSIACEYCCGAQTLVFSNGQRACGCAHSYAMRGLAKYLLKNHPDMTDLEILEELGKWKVLFFPGVHEQKAQVLKANDIDYTNYVNLASNLYRGIENQQSSSGGGGQMVGGC